MLTGYLSVSYNTICQLIMDDGVLTWDGIVLEKNPSTLTHGCHYLGITQLLFRIMKTQLGLVQGLKGWLAYHICMVQYILLMCTGTKEKKKIQ